MSWMDSWSRPRKSQAMPPPLYLTSGGEEVPYCHTCGRVISSRKSAAAAAKSGAAKTTGVSKNAGKGSVVEKVKYCSDRCKRHKPGALDRRIEAAFVALLGGEDPVALRRRALNVNQAKGPAERDGEGAEAEADSAKQGEGEGKHGKARGKKIKGDPRVLVPCSDVEFVVFGDRTDPSKTFGRNRNRAPRFLREDGEWRSVDMVDGPDDAAAAADAAADRDRGAGVGGDADAGDAAAATEPTDASLDSDLSDLSLSDGGADSAASHHGGDNTSGSEDGGVALSAPSAPSKLSKDGGARVRPPQSESEVNFSAAGGERGWAEKIAETPEMLAKRREGERRAQEKEMVKSAARRACVFGLVVEKGEGGGGGKKGGKEGGSGKEDGRKGGAKGKKGFVEDDVVGIREEERRMCEAVMNGAVVEPSFAKGDWAIRWREE